MSEVNNMTLQQIKDSLPKYCCLTSPDIAKEGDVVAVTIKEKGSRGGEIAYEECEVVIRPIPDEVLENQAFWVLYNKLATVAPGKGGWTIDVSMDGKSIIFPAVYEYAALKFNSEKEAWNAAQLLGGEQNIVKQLSAGDLYSKWLGEQLTWQ